MTRQKGDGEGQETERQRAVDRQRRSDEVRRKYDFGVIRQLRQDKGLTIEQFAKKCGLSYAPISRIETNLIKPNLETLDKIAFGLGITTYNLVAMAERRETHVQRAREYRSGGFSFQVVTYEGIEVYFGEGKDGSVATDPTIHSRDFATLVVRTGSLEVKLNDRSLRLGPGEAISFDCVFPHMYAAVEDVSFVVIAHSRQ